MNEIKAACLVFVVWVAAIGCAHVVRETPHVHTADELELLMLGVDAGILDADCRPPPPEVLDAVYGGDIDAWDGEYEDECYTF